MEGKDRRTLFCGNLDDQVTEDDLYELFAQAGPVERILLPRLKNVFKKENKPADVDEGKKTTIDDDVDLDIRDLMENNVQYGQCNNAVCELKLPVVDPYELKKHTEYVTSSRLKGDKKLISAIGVDNLVTDEFLVSPNKKQGKSAEGNCPDFGIDLEDIDKDLKNTIIKDDDCNNNETSNGNEKCKDGKHQKYAFIIFKHECVIDYAKKMFSHTLLFGRKLVLRNRRKNKKNRDSITPSNEVEHAESSADSIPATNTPDSRSKPELDVLYHADMRGELDGRANNANRRRAAQNYRGGDFKPTGSISRIHTARCWNLHSATNFEPQHPRTRNNYQERYLPRGQEAPSNQYQRRSRTAECDIPPYPFAGGSRSCDTGYSAPSNYYNGNSSNRGKGNVSNKNYSQNQYYRNASNYEYKDKQRNTFSKHSFSSPKYQCSDGYPGRKTEDRLYGYRNHMSHYDNNHENSYYNRDNSYENPANSYSNRDNVNPDNSNVNPENSYVSRDTLYVNPGNSYADPDSSYVNPDISYVNPDASYVNPDISYVNPDASYVNPDISYVNPDASYVNPDISYVNPDASYVNPDHLYNTAYSYDHPDTSYYVQDSAYANPDIYPEVYDLSTQFHFNNCYPLLYSSGGLSDGTPVYGCPYAYTSEPYAMPSYGVEQESSDCIEENAEPVSRYPEVVYDEAEIREPISTNAASGGRVRDLEESQSRETFQKDERKRSEILAYGDRSEFDRGNKANATRETGSDTNPSVVDGPLEYSSWEPSPEQEESIREEVERRNQSHRRDSRLNMDHFLTRYNQGESDNTPRLRPSECHVKLSESIDLALDKFNKAKVSEPAGGSATDCAAGGARKKKKKHRKSKKHAVVQDLVG